jgi:hypothetical protein
LIHDAHDISLSQKVNLRIPVCTLSQFFVTRWS